MIYTRGLDLALLILRLFFGGLMLAVHGWPKWQKLFGPDPVSFADPLGLGETVSLTLAVFAECLCALLVVLGLFTRWATIPLLFTMVVAVFFVHAGDPLPKLEMGLLYLAAFLALLLLGPGQYSLDARFRTLP